MKRGGSRNYGRGGSQYNPNYNNQNRGGGGGPNSNPNRGNLRNPFATKSARGTNQEQEPDQPDRPTHNYRFTSQNETLEDVLKSQTVGLVHLSEFKKRRVELLEQQENEAAIAAEGVVGGTATGGKAEKGAGGGSGDVSKEGSRAATPSDGNVKAQPNKKRKKVPVARGMLSFGTGDDEDEEGGFSSAGPGTPAADTPKEKEDTPMEEAASKEGTPKEGTPSGEVVTAPSKPKAKSSKPAMSFDDDEEPALDQPKRKFQTAAPSNLPTPTVITKATMRKEAEMRVALRREFNKLQEQIKQEEITIPFVFYDGVNIPGGECKMKKGEAVWLFLERARRTRGLWHRVSVDDLMLVRGEIIIPHHYEFYYFIVNRTLGPHGILFDYPSALTADGRKANAKKEDEAERPPDDPTLTKVVDRRWYERHKHIFPASMWDTFDPNKDYTNQVRRDRSENAFFFT